MAKPKPPHRDNPTPQRIELLRFAPTLLLSGYYCYAYLLFNRLFFASSENIALHPTLIQLSLAIAAGAAMLTSRKTSFDLTSTRTITLTGLLFIMGTVFGFLGISNTPFSGLTAKLIGIGLFCVAFVLYSMIWARVFERLSPAKTLLVIALSVCFSTIIRAFTYIDIHGSIVGGIALSVILCCSLFQASRCQQLSQETWAIDFNRELPNQPFKERLR